MHSVLIGAVILHQFFAVIEPEGLRGELASRVTLAVASVDARGDDNVP
jgi:hypothetical protein